MRRILLFLIVLFVANNVNAQPFIGGEISWSCASSGNYHFEFKYYQDCGGITYPNQLNIQTTVPGLSAIIMNLVSVSEITPVCNSAGPAIKCIGQTAQNAGMVRQWIYNSKTAFPNGVPLNGVPPANGWLFYYNYCCRLPSSNIIGANSTDFMYRAIMYPYNNQSANVCYDNAPDFNEAPPTILCANEQAWINFSAQDIDNDSLVYEFAYALDNGLNNPITNYFPGYSYSSPFPGPASNPNNIAASLNPSTGLMNLTSFTTGAFTSVVRVSSYREGQLISEISRDFQTAIDTCGVNTSPDASFQNGLYEYIDTVRFGEMVNFSVSVSDLELLPNGIPQTIIMEALSEHFGDNDTNTSVGCPFPPCAVLSPPGISSGQSGLQKTVQWQTDCNHVNGNNTYDFIFKQRDDFCPVPSISYAIARITVQDYPEVPTPGKLCVNTLVNGDIAINWPMISDSLSQLHAYLLYHFDSLSNQFIILDTIFNNGTTNYIHQNAGGHLSSQTYQMRTLSGCNGKRLSTPSEVSSSIYLEAITHSATIHFVQLNWNTPTNSANTTYEVWADYSNGFIQIATTNDTSYVDTSANALPWNNYKILSVDTIGIDSLGLPIVCAFESNHVLIVGNMEYGLDGFTLAQNNPNPGDEGTIIEFELPSSGKLVFRVANLIGEGMFVNKSHRNAGAHLFEINTSEYPAGIYFYSIEFEGYKLSKKMIITH